MSRNIKQALLAGTLASFFSGSSKADDVPQYNTSQNQNDCIDELVLDIQIKEEKDIFSETFYTADEEQRNNLQQQLLTLIQRIYTDKLGIPVKIEYFGPRKIEDNKKYEGNTIRVVYTSKEQLMREEFHEPKDVLDFIKRNLSPDEREVWEIKLKSFNNLSYTEQTFVKEQLRESFLNSLNKVEAITDRALRKIYIFSIEDLYSTVSGFSFFLDSPYLIADINSYTITLLSRNLNHEIGHLILGRGHAAAEINEDGKLNLMYATISLNQRTKIAHGQYDFSIEDKQKIFSQVCSKE